LNLSASEPKPDFQVFDCTTVRLNARSEEVERRKAAEAEVNLKK
jgi:hypothetical protein